MASREGRPVVKHGSWCHLPPSANERMENGQVVTEPGGYWGWGVDGGVEGGRKGGGGGSI